MATWRTSTEPLTLSEGKHYSPNSWLQVEPGTGNVQIQLLQSDGLTWYTPTNEDHTTDVAGAMRIERRNAPTIRILATGNAQFALTGSDT